MLWPPTSTEVEARKYAVGKHTMVARKVDKLFNSFQLVCDDECVCKKPNEAATRRFELQHAAMGKVAEGIRWADGSGAFKWCGSYGTEGGGLIQLSDFDAYTSKRYWRENGKNYKLVWLD